MLLAVFLRRRFSEELSNPPTAVATEERPGAVERSRPKKAPVPSTARAYLREFL